MNATTGETANAPPCALPLTARLALRRFTPHDLDLLLRLHTDARVMRFVGGTKTREQSENELRTRILDYYERFPGLGVWLTIERASGARVGLHLLNHIQGETIVQVGYILAPEYWGRGYASEMARALLHYGFTTLRLATIAGITDLDNVESQRALLKAGLHRNGERTFAHPAYGGEPLAWFERDATGWLAERAQSASAAIPR